MKKAKIKNVILKNDKALAYHSCNHILKNKIIWVIIKDKIKGIWLNFKYFCKRYSIKNNHKKHTIKKPPQYIWEFTSNVHCNGFVYAYGGNNNNATLTQKLDGFKKCFFLYIKAYLDTTAINDTKGYIHITFVLKKNNIQKAILIFDKLNQPSVFQIKI